MEGLNEAAELYVAAVVMLNAAESLHLQARKESNSAKRAVASEIDRCVLPLLHAPQGVDPVSWEVAFLRASQAVTRLAKSLREEEMEEGPASYVDEVAALRVAAMVMLNVGAILSAQGQREGNKVKEQVAFSIKACATQIYGLFPQLNTDRDAIWVQAWVNAQREVAVLAEAITSCETPSAAVRFVNPEGDTQGPP